MTRDYLEGEEFIDNRPRSRRPTFSQEFWMPRVYAWWNGRCPNCGIETVEGDPVYKAQALVDQDSFPWVCEYCAPEFSPR